LFLVSFTKYLKRYFEIFCKISQKIFWIRFLSFDVINYVLK
jgi:hypothetical protein